jgi:hypothetical protein
VIGSERVVTVAGTRELNAHGDGSDHGGERYRDDTDDGGVENGVRETTVLAGVLRSAETVGDPAKRVESGHRS